ncbi:MAG: hypothetical protein K2M30_02225, partial [Desulfovibrionaceae bacterium]|nr:hypothetical protein [Desulfovibrionaceae bacterium]
RFLPVGRPSPSQWSSGGIGIEEIVGNLPQTVLFASSCIIQMLIDYLLGRECKHRSLLFDIERFLIQEVEM